MPLPSSTAAPPKTCELRSISALDGAAAHVDGQPSPVPLIVADLRSPGRFGVCQVVDQPPMRLSRLHPVELVVGKCKNGTRVVCTEAIFNDAQAPIAGLASV